MSIFELFIYAIGALLVVFLGRRMLQRARMKEYTPKQVAEMLNDTSIVLLDVRTSVERSRQCIQGSLHIPLRDLVANVSNLEPFRSKEIICYCHSGRRSMAAAEFLQKHGFHAANLHGGMTEWNYQNLK